MNALNIVDTYAFYQALKEGANVILGKTEDVDANDIPNIILYKKDKMLFLNLEDKVLEPLEIIKLMKKYNDVEKVIINLDLTLDYKTPENYINALNTAEQKIKDYYHTKAKVFIKLFRFLKDKVIAQFIAAVYSLVKIFVNISKYIATTVFKILKNIGTVGLKLLQSAINMIKKESYVVLEQNNSKSVADTMVYVRLHVDKNISEHELFNSIMNIQLQDLETYAILTKTVVINKFDKLYTVNFPEKFQIIKIFIVGAPFELDIEYNYNEKTRFLDVTIRRHTRLFSVSLVEDIFIVGVYILLFAAVIGIVFDVGVLTALGYGSAQLLNESLLYAFYSLIMKGIISSTIMSGIVLAFLKSHEIKRVLKQLGLIRENQIIIKVIEDQNEEELQKLEKQIREKARKKIKHKHKHHKHHKERHRR